MESDDAEHAAGDDDTTGDDHDAYALGHDDEDKDADPHGAASDVGTH